ncbi:hypothetical protein DYB37_009678 [Aphanomyces astaci]|uniref:Uncharacterized protein n=1 Tax=Aphanomyces astaci TaxID=112090 RepID=A0A3R6XSY8_APHAT|nr:hypothetical protein DYB37_009678 [Aphanomyces astaci]
MSKYYPIILRVDCIRMSKARVLLDESSAVDRHFRLKCIPTSVASTNSDDDGKAEVMSNLVLVEDKLASGGVGRVVLEHVVLQLAKSSRAKRFIRVHLDVHNELNKPTTTTATAAAARFRHQELRDMTVSVAAGKALQHREVRVTLHFGTACVLEFVIQVGVSLKYDTKLRQGPEGESIQVCDALVESVVPPLGWVADNNTTSRQQLAPHKSMQVLVNKESFEETINPNTTSDNMTISDFIVDLCDEHVGDDGSCTVDQFYRVLDTISARAASELKLTTGDKIRTCYVIDRTLNSKRMSEGDVRKLSEHYQSKGVHMLLQWVVEAAWNPHEHDCANLLLRLLISLPPKDSVVRREFAGILTEQLPHRHGTTRELLQQLLTAFQ